MKIQGPGPPQPPRSYRLERRKDASAASFAAELGAAAGAGAADGAAPPAPAGGLLVLQEVSEAGADERRRARRRGDAVLDQLEALRDGLLAGRLPQARLHQLIDVLQAERVTAGDPHVRAVLDEIELRARVELAKFERARAGSG